MQNHHNKLIGQKGERVAAAFLEAKGFQILEMNWRHGHKEVDIIACLGKTLHFIEVKTRTSTLFGMPETAVSATKMKLLREAAEIYQYNHPEWEKVQFDVLGILMPKNGKMEFLFNEDVYF